MTYDRYFTAHTASELQSLLDNLSGSTCITVDGHISVDSSISISKVQKPLLLCGLDTATDHGHSVIDNLQYLSPGGSAPFSVRAYYQPSTAEHPLALNVRQSQGYDITTKLEGKIELVEDPQSSSDSPGTPKVAGSKNYRLKQILNDADTQFKVGSEVGETLNGTFQKGSFLFVQTKWMVYRFKVEEVYTPSQNEEYRYLLSTYATDVDLKNFKGEKCHIKVVNDSRFDGDFYHSNNVYHFDPGIDASDVKVASSVNCLLEVSGTQAEVAIENITFSNNALTDKGITALPKSQAEYNSCTGALRLAPSASCITVKNCCFTAIYDYAITAYNPTSQEDCANVSSAAVSGSVSVIDNTITESFGGGIALYDRCDRAEIRANHIENIGNVQAGCVGILATFGSGMRICDNIITNVKYSGISLGWSWGYFRKDSGPDYSSYPHEQASVNNLVSGNRISNCLQEITSDGGGIYTLGWSEGTVIRDNLIHNIRSEVSKPRDAAGIYLDEGSSLMKICGNVVYDCPVAIHQHYGYYNELYNNIFAKISVSVFRSSRREDHLEFYAHHNFILSPEAGASLQFPRTDVPIFLIANNLVALGYVENMPDLQHDERFVGNELTSLSFEPLNGSAPGTDSWKLTDNGTDYIKPVAFIHSIAYELPSVGSGEESGNTVN